MRQHKFIHRLGTAQNNQLQEAVKKHPIPSRQGSRKSEATAHMRTAPLHETAVMSNTVVKWKILCHLIVDPRIGMVMKDRTRLGFGVVWWGGLSVDEVRMKRNPDVQRPCLVGAGNTKKWHYFHWPACWGKTKMWVGCMLVWRGFARNYCVCNKTHPWFMYTTSTVKCTLLMLWCYLCRKHWSMFNINIITRVSC